MNTRANSTGCERRFMIQKFDFTNKAILLQKYHFN